MDKVQRLVQLSLDLFGWGDVPEAMPVASAARLRAGQLASPGQPVTGLAPAGRPSPRGPPRPGPRTEGAGAAGDASPAFLPPTQHRLAPSHAAAPVGVAGADQAPVGPVLPDVLWHHPRANRRLRMPGCELGYEFKRGQRRTIGLTVGTDGVRVSAPRWTPLAEVDAFVLSKSDWLMQKRHQLTQLRHAQQQARTEWAEGCTLDYLGKPLRLALDPSHRFDVQDAMLAAQPDAPACLRLGLARHASPAQIQDAAQAWLMRQASQLFEDRLNHFGPPLGVRHSRLRLSNAGTRWGSASADGAIRLNWRLIHLPLDLIDYVVVHELSHLRHMNHSPQFWDVVASILPDHGERRQRLKRCALGTV